MNKEHEKLSRIGVEKSRSYYIPFAENQRFVFKHKIVDRSKSERFLSLDGTWFIKEYDCPENVQIGEKLTKKNPRACLRADARLRANSVYQLSFSVSVYAPVRAQEKPDVSL
jgi:hypothetical protein